VKTITWLVMRTFPRALCSYFLPLVLWAADSPCHIAGQIAGKDRVANTLTLKRDTGDLIDVHYDDSSIFSVRAELDAAVRNQPRLQPTELNLGDRVCVTRLQTGGEGPAAQIAVSSRAALRVKQQDELRGWLAHGVFGTIRALDPTARHITLETQDNGTPLTVDASGMVAYWDFPRGDIGLGDAVPGSWDSLAAGDPLYIYTVDNARGQVAASVILRGGVRAIAGGIQSFNGLTEEIVLRSLGSGQTRFIHSDFARMYLIGRPEGASSGTGRRKLYRMSLGDLQVGDSVLVLGREDRRNGRFEGLVVVSGLMVSGSFTPENGTNGNWIFNQLGFGVQPR
jgi:hypothetical protein